MEKVRIGLVGTGGISHAHMVGYSKLAKEGRIELVAACDLNVQRATEWAERYGFSEVYGDYHEMLEKSNIDAVSVCTWNDGHKPITIAALEAGKHVLCEKPPALNTAEAIEMKEAADKSGKLLMIGFVRRFGRNVVAAKDFADNGFLGEMNLAKIAVTRRNGCPLGWFANSKLSGGGPLIDNGVHLIDMVRYLTGKPRAVSAYGATYNNMGSRTYIKGMDRYASADPSDFNDVEDLAVGMVRFDNGMTLMLEFSYTQEIAEDVVAVELYGSKGGIIVEPSIKFMTEYNQYLVDMTPKLSEEPFSVNFERETAHFIDCIVGNQPSINPIEDGIELMRIIDALYESARIGAEVKIG